MVSGEGAAASNLTHGSMRRGSIAGILRKLGLSHYTKTQVDEKVAAALVGFVTNVAATDVALVYPTRTEMDVLISTLIQQAVDPITARVSTLEPKIAVLEQTNNRRQALDLLNDKVAALELLPDKVAALELLPDKVEALELLPDKVEALELLPDKVEALELLPDKVEALELLPDKVEALEPLTAKVAALEPLMTDISEVQTAIETVGDSVIDHRSTIDKMASRQAGLDGAWEGASAMSNGSYVFASYLVDNDISVPTFNWPWTQAGTGTETGTAPATAPATDTTDTETGTGTETGTAPATAPATDPTETETGTGTETGTAPDTPKTYHWIRQQVDEDGARTMNVAGSERGLNAGSVSYAETYEIGDYITIGGYTDHIVQLTALSSLSPDFINGSHIILSFETDLANSDYTHSFNVAVPSSEGSPMLSIYATRIEAWTIPTLAQTASLGDTTTDPFSLEIGDITDTTELITPPATP